MDATTNSYYKIEEDEHNRWISNKDDARQEFYEKIIAIQLKFEHLITESRDADEIYCVVVSVNDAQKVGKGLTAMDDLAFYKYNDPYDEAEFEYDFREELNAIKTDELGIEVEV